MQVGLLRSHGRLLRPTSACDRMKLQTFFDAAHLLIRCEPRWAGRDMPVGLLIVRRTSRSLSGLYADNAMKRRSIVWTLALLTAAVVGIWARQQMAIESRDQPATGVYLRILRRADALLGDASVWNRHDDRVCDDDEASGKRSLFCALQKADREILGEYQHRNVGLQEVRLVIQDATRDRQTEMVIRALRRFSLPHRLMDFNNLPETRFEDVKQVLRVASERIAARLESKQ